MRVEEEVAVVADLLVVADDLTGALDTGAQFARHGLRTCVAWGAGLPGGADVWVLDTESRDLLPAAAGARVAQAVAPLLSRCAHLYKKVDSTLRGNVAGELAALLAASVARRVALAPAFPAQGRTTLHGKQWVHGQPLAATPFAPPGAAGSALTALLARKMGVAVGSVELAVVRQGPGALGQALQARAEPVLVIDAVEESDLATVARAVAAAGPGWLLAGSAGLAAQLPAAWGLAGGLLGPPAPIGAGPVLLVVGTRHPALAGQLSYLQARAPVTVVGEVTAGLLARGDPLVTRRAEALAGALVAGRDVVLTSLGEPLVAGGARQVAALLADIVRRALAGVQPAALVLTGGDVAAAVCRALAAEAIVVEGEVAPGIPRGRLLGGPANGLCLVTKAGGFGGEEVLWQILSVLRGEESCE